MLQCLNTFSAAGLFLAITLASSCATDGARRHGDDPVRPEGVVAIRSSEFHFDWDGDIEPLRADLEGCVANAIRKQFTDLRFIPREAFCRAAFPNLPAGAAPIDLTSLIALLDSPEFRRRLDAMNMRYIVFVSGRTEIEDSHNWAGIGGYMAATVAGMSTWAKDTEATALVFDLKREVQSGDGISVDAEGESWVAGMFPFILGMPANTEGRACRAVAAQVVATIEAARFAEESQ